MRVARRLSGIALAFASLACSTSTQVEFFPQAATTTGLGAGGAGGAGTSSGSSTTLESVAVGAGGAGGSPYCGTELKGIVRDFHVAHPDFEDFIANDKGIVQETLGADKKPVYAGNPTTPTTTGKANFDQWYRDVPGVNTSVPLTLQLVDQGGGIYGYDNQAFFPIDGQGFGNENYNHNFHFTYELHTQFVYQGFEVFEFSGDDDLWVFLNQKLVINLGGVHGNQSGAVDLPANAAKLGMVVGKAYPLDLFFAERHTTESHFKVQTTIGSFTDCGDSNPK